MSKYIGGNSVYGVYDRQKIVGDGTNSVWNLIYQVGHPNSLLVTIDGVVQEPSISYTISEGGKKINFSFVPPLNEQIVIIFLGRELAVPAVAGNYPVRARFTGDGIQTNFDLTPSVPPVGVLIEDGLIVFVDGVQKHFDIDWNLDLGPTFETGMEVFFPVPPTNGSIIDVYIHGIERSDLVTVPDKTLTGVKFVDNLVMGSATDPVDTIYVDNIYITNTPIVSYQVGDIEIKTHTDYPNSEAKILTNAITTTSITPGLLFSIPVPDDSVGWFEVNIAAINTVTLPGTNKSFCSFSRGCVRKNALQNAFLFDYTLDHSGDENSTGYYIDVSVNGANLEVKVYGDNDSINWVGTLKRQFITTTTV